MSNETKPPQQPEEASSTVADMREKKNKRKYRETLENLLQEAKSQTDEISKIATKVQSEYVKFKKDIDDSNKNLAEDNKKFVEDKQNCLKIIEAIKTSKSQADNFANKIYDLHTEIFGEGDVADSGKEEVEDNKGLKYDLENAYLDTQTKFKVLKEGFEQLRQEKIDEFSNVLEEHRQRFEDTQKLIESLLPGALSAGLSSAFQQKRADIERMQRGHYTGFIISIIILTGLFCFTFWASASTSTLDVFFFFIFRHLLLASPIFWLAIFFNRKLNLNTRLIEEYTHKETVSKTFEGLSKEIQKVAEDDDSVNQLRQQLLKATMDVNTTNPGKLVKGYDVIDHPVTEVASSLSALSSLFKEINELKKLPGFNLTSVLGVVALAFKQNLPIPSETEPEEEA